MTRTITSEEARATIYEALGKELSGEVLEDMTDFSLACFVLTQRYKYAFQHDFTPEEQIVVSRITSGCGFNLAKMGEKQ